MTSKTPTRDVSRPSRDVAAADVVEEGVPGRFLDEDEQERRHDIVQEWRSRADRRLRKLAPSLALLRGAR